MRNIQVYSTAYLFTREQMVVKNDVPVKLPKAKHCDLCVGGHSGAAAEAQTGRAKKTATKVFSRRFEAVQAGRLGVRDFLGKRDCTR